MSRLDELIAELCPDGVEYNTVSVLIQNHVIKTITPTIKVKRNDYKMEGLTPIVSQEEEFISGYCDLVDKNIPMRNYVCFGDHSEHIKFVSFSFIQGADGLKIMYTNENRLIGKYFYYAVSGFYGRHNNYERHFKYLTDTAIPVPPLPVQQEIVRILDHFTELTAELQKQLDAELTARKKQYEYYRRVLIRRSTQAKYASLDDVANVFRGEYITKKETKEGNIPVVLGGQEPAYYIDKANHFGEIVTVARSGASAGFVSYWNEPIFITDGFGFEAKNGISIPKYRYYVLKDREKELNAMKRGAGVPHISGEMLGKTELPIPPIEDQKHIVSILDNLADICNDLSSGLPAEIAARQKQYEYYRDKLLTFKELKKS